MNKSLIAVGIVGLMLAATIPAMAQGNVTDPGGEVTKDGPPGINYNTDGCTAIPDDGYDGSLGSMACLTVPGADLIVSDVNVVLGVNHTWIGDLTVKVVSPAGTVTTLQSRAGFAEPADDGTGCCGDSSDLLQTSPVTYDDSAVDSAEDMGSTILGGNVACQDDGICDYFPFPDSGPGTNLGDFIGEDGSGDWQVCVGDSVGADAGEICSAEVIIEGTGVPTVPWQGLILLLAVLSAISLVMMRRRAHNG